MYVPLFCFAKNHANRPVRAFPTWSSPVGLGAKRTRVITNNIAADCADYADLLFQEHQRYGFSSDGLFGTDDAEALHGLRFDVDRVWGNPENFSDPGLHF